MTCPVILSNGVCRVRDTQDFVQGMTDMSVEGGSKAYAAQDSAPSPVEPQFDKYGNPRWPYLNLLSWKRLKFRCRECTWSGDGNQVEIGEIDEEVTELVCPDCGTFMAALSHRVEIPGLNKES